MLNASESQSRTPQNEGWSGGVKCLVCRGLAENRLDGLDCHGRPAVLAAQPECALLVVNDRGDRN